MPQRAAFCVIVSCILRSCHAPKTTKEDLARMILGGANEIRSKDSVLPPGVREADAEYSP